MPSFYTTHRDCPDLGKEDKAALCDSNGCIEEKIPNVGVIFKNLLALQVNDNHYVFMVLPNDSHNLVLTHWFKHPVLTPTTVKHLSPEKNKGFSDRVSSPMTISLYWWKFMKLVPFKVGALNRKSMAP